MWRPENWEKIKEDWQSLDAPELDEFERGANAMFTEVTRLIKVSTYYLELLACIKGVEDA